MTAIQEAKGGNGIVVSVRNKTLTVRSDAGLKAVRIVTVGGKTMKAVERKNISCRRGEGSAPYVLLSTREKVVCGGGRSAFTEASETCSRTLIWSGC